MGTLEKKYRLEWEKLIDELYLTHEEFEFKKAKRLVKKINTFQNNIIRKEHEIVTTLNLTDFHENDDIVEELKGAQTFILETLAVLENITKLEPKQEKGHYNYITNALAIIEN